MRGPMLFEISSGALGEGLSPFDVYAPGGDDEGMQPICRKGDSLDSEKKDELQRNAGHCFIRRSEVRLYIDYVFGRMRDIVEDEQIPVDEKAKILYLIAKRTITRTYMNPGEYQFFAEAARLVRWLVKARMRNREIPRHIFVLSAAENYRISHPLNVAVLNLLVGASIFGLKSQPLKKITFAGLMHDIGKSAIDQAIIDKPGPLTDFEFAKVQEHARYSYEILQNHHIEQEICLSCKHHHERMDGSGYPDGMEGKEIPLGARITAVCDVFDAITSKTSYRGALSHLEALSQMLGELGGLDHDIFDHLVRVVLQNEVLVHLFQKGEAGHAGSRLADYVKNRSIVVNGRSN